MNTVSLVGSTSRLAGGLFESVRRLHQELISEPETLESGKRESRTVVNVSVLGLRDPLSEIDLKAWEPVRVKASRVRGPAGFGYTTGVGRFLSEANPDLVHVHGLWQFNSIAALRWHRCSQKPYVVSPHGMLDRWALRNSAWKKELAWRIYEHRHLKMASCIRALCRSEADSIRALGLQNPICLIPNGVDVPPGICPQRRMGAEITGIVLPSKKVLLYLGRIHPKKGLENLLKAWAKAQRPKEWVLVIAGWDQQRHEQHLKTLARTLGISPQDNEGSLHNGAAVIFAGPQFGDKKHAWINRCQAVILPSYSEGVPMAVLEAWAHGKPALVTPQCNLPEGIRAGGALQIEANPEAIAARLETLFRLESRALADMGDRGRALVLQKFAWRTIVAELKEVYDWLVQGGEKPDCVLRL